MPGSLPQRAPHRAKKIEKSHVAATQPLKQPVAYVFTVDPPSHRNLYTPKPMEPWGLAIKRRGKTVGRGREDNREEKRGSVVFIVTSFVLLSLWVSHSDLSPPFLGFRFSFSTSSRGEERNRSLCFFFFSLRASWFFCASVTSSAFSFSLLFRGEAEGEQKEEEEERGERKKMYVGYVLWLWLASLATFAFLSRGWRRTETQKNRRKEADENVRSRHLGGHREGSEGRPDVIIVGAGIAGSALAYALGKDGRCVHVIERDLTEPDRIVGELLQPGGYLKLVELGLDDCMEQIDAQQVFGYALFKDGRDTKVSYPLENYDLSVSGRSFHNGRFIQRMRAKASALPNVRLEQGTVTALIEDCGIIKGVRYKSTNGDELESYAPLTVVCDGCFSNLRRSLCYPKVDVLSCFVGLVLENCDLPYPNHGHIILADPSPILFYPISSNEVRCLVDVPGQKVPSLANGEMAKYLTTFVAPQIPTQLRDAFLSAIDKGKIKTMPNRSMPACPSPTPGALLMGDAFNMRHPLTGGGMTVALSDVVLVSNLLKPLRDLNDAPSLCKYLESFYILRKPVASTINTLANALYKVFCASPDLAMKEMRQACFDYLSIGGACSSGPVSLLSGLNPRPLSLFLHFFAVAIYGVGRLLMPFPSPKRLWIGTRLILGASSIIFPIIKAEGFRQMFFPNTILAYYRSPPAS